MMVQKINHNAFRWNAATSLIKGNQQFVPLEQCECSPCSVRNISWVNGHESSFHRNVLCGSKNIKYSILNIT